MVFLYPQLKQLSYQTMKKQITLTSLIFFYFLHLCSTFSQDITLDWVEHLGTTDYDSPAKMMVDYSGNIYTSGKLTDTIDFDPGPGVYNLQPHLTEDLYIRKLDSEGNFDWVKPFKNLTYSEDSSIRDLGTDTLGNIYVSGALNGLIDFDPGPDTFTLENDGYSNTDVFIVKLDSNGNLTWAKKIGGLWDQNVEAMHVDRGGNMYLTGFFRNTVDFDPGVGVFNMTSTTYGNNYILKLDTNGDLVWAKQIGENQFEDFYLTDLINDESGNLFISGHFSGTYDLDPGPDVVNLTTLFANSFEYFLLKLDSVGEFVWVKQYRGAYQDVITTLTIDQSNNLLITGSYGGTVDFDFGPDTYELTSSFSINAYTLKLNLDGEFIWVKHIDGLQCTSCSSRSKGVAINTDQFNNVYTTGYFQNHIDIDSGDDSLIFHSEGSNVSYEDIYIQKLDSNGNFVWGGQIGGPLRERTNSIDLDHQNDILTFGWFYDTIDFDPGVNTYNLGSVGGNDVFLQKLTQCNSPLVPDSSALPVISGICNVQPTPPTASSNCIEGLSGVPNIPLPIIDEDITEIIWTFDDGYGNTATQTQAISWSSLDLSSSQNGFTITANNTNATYQWLDCGNNYSQIIGDTNIDYTATINGNYAVEITENGCVDTSACVSIECSEIVLDISTTLNGLTITANNTNATYQWLNCDNNNAPLTGENDAYYTATTNGNYAVEINQNDCVDTSACISIANIGLNELDDLTLSVYPNPSKDVFNITFEKEIEYAVLSLSNTLGQSIYTTEVKQTSKTSINLKDKPSGLYFLTITSENSQKNIELIKE